MGKSVAVLTDSNSGITQNCAKALGISVLPMPFYINDELFYEDITLTQEEFYRHLEDDAEIHTSMPVVGEVLDRWDSLLKDYDEVVYIPMSSGLSSSCATAKTLAEAGVINPNGFKRITERLVKSGIIKRVGEDKYYV